MPIQGSDGLIDMGVCRPSNYYHRRARGEVSVADGLVVMGARRFRLFGTGSENQPVHTEIERRPADRLLLAPLSPRSQSLDLSYVYTQLQRGRRSVQETAAKIMYGGGPQQNSSSPTTASSTPMPPAPQPNQQQRTMKQRRVSLPASASMQSISARLDPRLNGGAASTSSSHNGTLHASEKNHLHQIMGPPSSTITQARGSGNWGARTSRDDSSLPSTSSLATNAPGSPPSPSLDYDMSNGHHHARRASASYGAAPHLALTNSSDQATTAAASGSNSRRRRAATVSTNKPGAKANANNGDFIVPPDPSSSMIPSASSSTTNSNSHSTSSASSSLSPPPPEPSPPQGEPSGSNAGPPAKVRKPRKRWTMEETQALVDGCNKVSVAPL